jgi:hypothetical protein
MKVLRLLWLFFLTGQWTPRRLHNYLQTLAVFDYNGALSGIDAKVWEIPEVKSYWRDTMRHYFKAVLAQGSTSLNFPNTTRAEALEQLMKLSPRAIVMSIDDRMSLIFYKLPVD